MISKFRRQSISISKDLKKSFGGKNSRESNYLANVTGGQETYHNFLKISQNEREHSPRPSNKNVRSNYVRELNRDSENKKDEEEHQLFTLYTLRQRNSQDFGRQRPVSAIVGESSTNGLNFTTSTSTKTTSVKSNRSSMLITSSGLYGGDKQYNNLNEKRKKAKSVNQLYKVSSQTPYDTSNSPRSSPRTNTRTNSPNCSKVAHRIDDPDFKHCASPKLGKSSSRGQLFLSVPPKQKGRGLKRSMSDIFSKAGIGKGKSGGGEKKSGLKRADSFVQLGKERGKEVFGRMKRFFSNLKK